jgi:2',3'-cyclic-nucleotide 2'-phosphodiesterase (5'-nucleotidase family)
MTKLICIPIAILLLVSCGAKKQYMVTSMSGTYIPVTTSSYGSEEMADFIAFYKEILDQEMNKVVGHSAQYMTTGRPESLLTNLTSDFMLQLDNSYNEGQPIDAAFMNVHGIRAPIAEGKITIGDIFDTYPFDNTLAIVKLEGKYLTKLFESYAAMGGAGLSKNIKLVIKDNKLQNASIDGKPVDESKIYTIVTLDYLAEGNDGMDALKNAISVEQTGITLRDYILDNIRKLEVQGQKLSSSLDGRITVVN